MILKWQESAGLFPGKTLKILNPLKGCQILLFREWDNPLLSETVRVIQKQERSYLGSLFNTFYRTPYSAGWSVQTGG